MEIGIKIVNLRMPAELKAWLEAEATKNLRSLNNEVVFKLSELKEKQTTDRAD
ncbi:Arc family DNA-binding protein [Paraburkholderia sp. SIMBA_030]|uniref:Arc family DNA-binding protein n=1 Tax=Paraburkholderia sp. SIMBA_030 TaxID=3085773 RepID=UPI003977F3CE